MLARTTYRVLARYAPELHLNAFGGPSARREPRPSEPALQVNILKISNLFDLVQPLLRDLPEAFLLVDGRVPGKRYGRLIDVAKRQYAGNAHGMVTGIGLVNLGHGSGEAGNFLPWTSACTPPTTMDRRKTTIFWPCLTRSWTNATS